MAFSLGTAVFALLSCDVFAAPQHVPPKISGTPQQLGHTSDPNFITGNASIPNDPGYYTDGGAGGLVNGYHLLTLSDARKLGELPTHVVYAYTAATDPTKITIIGNYASNPHDFLKGPQGNGQGVVYSSPGDACTNENFAPGPNTMMIPIGGGNTTGGINVFSVYCGNPGVVQYNTMIEYNVNNLEGLVANSQNIPVSRTVQKLFLSNQPLYGTDGFAADDTYFYLGARNDNHFKLARVPKASRTNLSAYQYYYPSGGWMDHTHLPSASDNSTGTNFFIATQSDHGVQFGTDLFFSTYFNTWIILYNSIGTYTPLLDLAYSTSGNVEGPYTDLPGFYVPPLDVGCDSKSPDYNPASDGGVPLTYLSHAHPDYDASGKTLMVSWISCNTFTNFAKITFQ